MMAWASSLWTLPNTLLGFWLFWAFGADLEEIEDRVWYWRPAAGLWRWWANRGWGGITFGECVLIAYPSHTLIDHELAHVRQYRALGPFFLPAYGLASLFAWMTGRHYYRDNYFEKRATEAE